MWSSADESINTTDFKLKHVMFLKILGRGASAFSAHPDTPLDIRDMREAPKLGERWRRRSVRSLRDAVSLLRGSDNFHPENSRGNVLNRLRGNETRFIYRKTSVRRICDVQNYLWNSSAKKYPSKTMKRDNEFNFFSHV